MEAPLTDASLVKFLTASGTGTHSGYRWPLPSDNAPGEWVTVKGELVPCARGLHLCRLSDAPIWLAATAYEAEYEGERIDVDTPSAETKIVVRKARLVRRLTTWNERTMRMFACDCAERVLPIYEAESPGDTRPRDAIVVARRFANGEATRAELAAAWAAAWDAAWDAAGGAAWGAAWDAAGAAAWDAAITTERQWQAQRFLAYINDTAQPLTAADLIAPRSAVQS